MSSAAKVKTFNLFTNQIRNVHRMFIDIFSTIWYNKNVIREADSTNAERGITMGMTVKKMNTEKTSAINMIHAILNFTTQGNCVTCNSVEQYLTKKAFYCTYTAEISTILKILTEMGYFTMEYGKTEQCPNTVEKIYTRTDKLNDIF